MAEVVVAHFVLRQQDKVPAGAVDDILSPLAVEGFLVGHGVASAPRAVALAARYRLKGHEGAVARRLFQPAVHFLAIVQQLLDAVHIPVVGQRHGVHPAAKAFLYYIRHFRHPVQHRIVRVYMQMRKVHNISSY